MNIKHGTHVAEVEVPSEDYKAKVAVSFSNDWTLDYLSNHDIDKEQIFLVQFDTSKELDDVDNYNEVLDSLEVYPDHLLSQAAWIGNFSEESIPEVISHKIRQLFTSPMGSQFNVEIVDTEKPELVKL